jgi:signal transduction histidine kinase
MPANPWLAVDAGTPPALRARELRREWEQFISEGRVHGVRVPVADSWRRSRDAGVDPAGRRLAPVAVDRHEAFERWEAHPLAAAAPLIRHCLGGLADESQHLIVVTDAAGVLLQVDGDVRVRSRAADSMNFTEGALWSEWGAGTNAIGTALAADHPVQIFATEHFVEVVQAWTCSAAPVHDPETGELLGVIDLTGLEQHVHPESLAIVMTTARAVEGHLRSRMQERFVGGAHRRARRRLATTVAHDMSTDETFAAVAEEIVALFGAEDVAVARFERDRVATVVAGQGWWVDELGIGVRFELDDFPAVATVSNTGRSARVHSAVAGPVISAGRLWGAVVASSRRDPLPADAVERMANFTELVGLVIANAESRAELAASRARVVAAGDEARRRIERDLHDGAQARLAGTVIALKLARRQLGESGGPVAELVDEALAQAEGAHRELRELAHGILPGALRHGGLRAGLDALVSRVRLPVSVVVTAERLPVALEATAYFIVAEALTNAVKHARANSAQVAVVVEGETMRILVRDDGVGGARADGSGLLGLRDRVAASNGELLVDSPPGGGTVIAATIPVPDADG